MLTPEAVNIAREKIINPYAEPYPYWHRTSFFKLESILTFGLMAWDFAEKNNSTFYKRNFKNPWNKFYISLGTRRPVEVLPENDTIVIIDSSKVIAIDWMELGPNPYEPFDHMDEVLVKDHILSDAFIGIVVGAYYPDYLPFLSLEEIEKILERTIPTSPLPFYAATELIWPV